MVKKVTCMLVMLLFCGLIALTCTEAKAQTASPSQAVITVSGVPTGTAGLAVGVTVDTAVVTLSSSASSDVSGSLVVVDSMSAGVGIINTSGNLPASFTITAPFTGVAAGTSMVSVGNVLDMLGGTAIAGAMATVNISSVTVASSSSTSSTSSTSSSSSSSTGGAGGMLSADTFTITVTGDAVKQTSALNVTLAFSDSTVANLATGVSLMGTGATQLLTDVNVGTGVITAVWDGTITDGMATITGMLTAGSMAGTTNLAVTKVEAAGGNNITANVVAQVDPSSVTNSSTTNTDVGTFTLLGPDSVKGPGKAAIAFSAANTAAGTTAKLNGVKVDFVDPSVGIAVVDLTGAMGSLNLNLVVTSGGMDTTVSLGKITVDAGSGKLPSIKTAVAISASNSLTVTGKKFSKTDTTVTVVPESSARVADTSKVTATKVKETYPTGECVPTGSYVNVETPAGTASKKVTVKGTCAHPLTE